MHIHIMLLFTWAAYVHVHYAILHMHFAPKRMEKEERAGGRGSRSSASSSAQQSAC